MKMSLVLKMYVHVMILKQSVVMAIFPYIFVAFAVKGSYSDYIKPLL